MRGFNFTSLLLLICVILLSIYIGGREINERIEETIKNNYLTELDALKEKLNKQGELISSMINASSGGQDGGSADTNDDPVGGTASGDTSGDEVEPLGFTYAKENGGITITGYTGKLKSITVPERIDGLPVLKIGNRAFAESSLRSVTLPSSCLEIDWFAFYGCYALNTVYISSEVEIIGYGAFDSCSRALVIYCESGSYAERYAKSFGLSVEHINKG